MGGGGGGVRVYHSSLKWLHLHQDFKKVFPIVKMEEKYGDVLTLLTILHTERPKLHTILAFLSAIGIRECVLFQSSRTTSPFRFLLKFF